MVPAALATSSMPISSPISVTRSPRRTALSGNAVTSIANRSIEMRPAIGQRFPATMTSAPGASSVEPAERR